MSDSKKPSETWSRILRDHLPGLFVALGLAHPLGRHPARDSRADVNKMHAHLGGKFRRHVQAARAACLFVSLLQC